MEDIVIDTAGFIHWPHDRLRGCIISVLQLPEIEKHAPNNFVLLDQLDVRVKSPEPDSLDAVLRMASTTGDLGGLSKVDLEVLALGHQLDCEIATDDHRMQNVASANGINWMPVSGAGISKTWLWRYICQGCKKEWSKGQGILDGGVCDVCGSDVRLLKK